MHVYASGQTPYRWRVTSPSYPALHFLRVMHVHSILCKVSWRKMGNNSQRTRIHSTAGTEERIHLVEGCRKYLMVNDVDNTSGFFCCSIHVTSTTLMGSCMATFSCVFSVYRIDSNRFARIFILKCRTWL